MPAKIVVPSDVTILEDVNVSAVGTGEAQDWATPCADPREAWAARYGTHAPPPLQQDGCRRHEAELLT
eukprot:817842-Amphidinium_carterae.1